jgi:hypothetical protein
MQTRDAKIIGLSRTKTLRLLGGSLAFVAGGAWMLHLSAADIERLPGFNLPWLTHGLGVVLVVFFGLGVLVGVRKLLDRRPGLVLDAQGLHDNTSGVSAGLVPWRDVTGFSVFEAFGQRSLIVHVSDPSKYAALGGIAGRALRRINLKLCGSPVTLASQSLQVGFDELVDLCLLYHHRYGLPR